MYSSLRPLLLFCCVIVLTVLCSDGTGGQNQPVDGSVTITVDTPPVVALTFDDGPRVDTTTRLLDGLILREVPATFFILGASIQGNEALIHRMAQEGHQIGLHSYNHIPLSDLSLKDFDFQVSAPRQQLTALLPDETFWLRPPYGKFDDAVLLRADSPIILWSLDPEDWNLKNTDQIVDFVLSHIKDGDIILLHDIYEETVDATFVIIDALLERGYIFATVEELMAYRSIVPENGAIYRQLPPTSP